MRPSIAQDRLAQFVVNTDNDLDYDASRARLERASLLLSADTAATTAWGQAALLTIAEVACRMFRGGVYLDSTFDVSTIVGNLAPVSLRRSLVVAGCRTMHAPDHALPLHVGSELLVRTGLQCWTDGWTANVASRGVVGQPLAGNEISGALAGAMAVSEAFRLMVLNDRLAGRVTRQLNPLTPDDVAPKVATLDVLPASCWLLGLGNLGQAVLWILGLLPYHDPAEVLLLLQDPDTAAPENLDVQILTKPAWLNQKKARVAAEWAEGRGFRTIVSERFFTAQTRRAPDEPGLAFVGVDNLPTRRAAARSDAGFDLLLDAGLGATSDEAFDIRLHGFPGFREPAKAWPDISSSSSETGRLTPALSRLIEQRRLDLCGAMEIAGQSVGVPCTAIAAAAIQVAQAYRALRTSRYCDFVDVSLIDTRLVSTNEATLQRGGVLQAARVRKTL